MTKDQLLPLSGFRDQLGPVKGFVLDVLKKSFRSYGYDELETPSLEKKEILLSKYGDEATKLLYLFKDNGKREVGLRYDLTVPLARFVAGNINTLVLPFKRYEIGSVWRAEKPQKGRYRQFTQADIDIIGVGGVEAEKELIAVVADVAKKLDIKLTCKINDRQILALALKDIGVDKTLFGKVMIIVDKLDKLPKSEVLNELGKAGLKKQLVEKIEKCLIEVDDGFWQKYLKQNKSVNELVEFASRQGLQARFVPSLMRGLDYYTGTIFEFVADGYRSAVVAGGRYDALVEDFVGKKIPSVGLSFGVDRLIDLSGDKFTSKIAKENIFIAKATTELAGFDEWLRKLRGAGKQVELYLGDKTLGDQLKYANRKGYKKVIIIDENWKSGKVVVKDMDSGEQKLVDRNSI